MTKEITRQDLIKKYIDFFKSKGHKEIPSSSLIPENDPTVLFTTAGMHPLVPYLLGHPHPLGKRLVDVQKCIRTGDIESVGDEVHHTFFEMLGQWSLGDYFKKGAIEFAFEFLTKNLNISKENMAVSVFEGNKDAPKDTESEKIWLSLGISKERIAFLPVEDNWWGPAGQTGPCGPDTEVFYWKNKNKTPKIFNPNDRNWVEIWNCGVFMQYNKKKSIMLVDGMHCLYDKDFKINQELLDLLNLISNKKIVVVNGFANKAKELLEEYNFEVFSLENENIKKDDKKFFELLVKKYSLNINEIVYFDHLEENINSAKKIGIKSELYNGTKQIAKFIDNNLSIYEQLSQKNVDTGMGVERTVTILNGLDDNYKSSIFQPIIGEIEKLSNKKYDKNEKETKAMRIIADHIRAAVFILGDERGIKPSNVEQGYVLRRLIRRAIRYGKLLEIKDSFTAKVAERVFPVYKDYPELERNHKFIISQLNEEENKFDQTLEKGLKKLDELVKNSKNNSLCGKDAFLLFQSYGFPIEMTQELAKEKNIKLNLNEYECEMKKHQELSRTASSGTFKSGLADNSEMTTKLHTATHLLNEALKEILNDKDIKQKGSNITPERLRFDFNFSRKLTDEELKKVEDLVNKKIKESLEVKREDMPLEKAVKSGAQAEFGTKYPEVVCVYSIKDKNNKIGWFSKEICTGPHVNNTKELGHFKIIKEESVAAGIRRIKAILE
ncbi:MAG: alanine--tRNA ligase-related protein [Candidatus Pacearchaeota archaeon]